MPTIQWTIAIGLLALVGCQSSPSGAPSAQTQGSADSSGTASRRGGEEPVIAYIQGQPVFASQLRASLMEAAGSEVFADMVIDRQVRRRLDGRGIKLSPAQIDAERAIMLEALHEDVNQAQRLLNELRRRRGWGEVRFRQMLERNAGLRLLVDDQVQVHDSAVRQAFDVQYGPTFQARLIVVEGASLASRIVGEARSGRSFVDLVMEHSIDASRAQGGLLAPISPADAAYPQAIREVLMRLQPGEVGPPVAIDNGLAILKLESKTEGRNVQFDDVQQRLQEQVRRQAQRVLMQQLARTLLEQADVVVLDGTLKTGWSEQRRNVAP